MSRIRRCFAAAGVVLAAGLLASCASATPPAPAEEPAIAAPPQAQAGRSGADGDVERAYERFWQVSRSLPQRPVERWRPELERVAAGPMAETILANLAQQRAAGIGLYGEIHPRITGVRLEGTRAVVTDCQDTSQSGQAEADTGKPRTVGVARNLTSGTLERGPDGTWRVVRIDYPHRGC